MHMEMLCFGQFYARSRNNKMATMSGGVVERANTNEENKQVLSELMRRTKFVEPSQEELSKLFAKLNSENARELVKNMKSYEPAWRNKKVTDRLYGPIPGIPSGSWWGIRMDCSRDRMHDPFNASVQCGPVGAVSICTSHSNDDVDLGNMLTFTGQLYVQEQDYVGRVIGDKEQNQGNRSLILNFENRVPVRVVRSYDLLNEYSPKTGYRYDGLYAVVKYWIGVSPQNGTRCYKFALKRLIHQEPPPWKSQISQDNTVKPVTKQISKSCNLQDRREPPLRLNTNTNDTIISRCNFVKRFKNKDEKATYPVESCGSTISKMIEPAQEQSLVDEKNLKKESTSREAAILTLTSPDRKSISIDHQNVHGSTIVTRRVSKKLQTNRIEDKLPFDSIDKSSRNVFAGKEMCLRNSEEEEDSSKCHSTRLQNTNISIRTDLYDSSHNLKHCVDKRGSNIIHGSGIFKSRILGVQRRQLHLPVVDSSPGSSRSICSVKMERITLDSSRKLNPNISNSEKEKSFLHDHQNPKLSTEASNFHLKTSARSNEQSNASQLVKSQLHDDRIEENCRNFVNKVPNENKKLSNQGQQDKKLEKSIECRNSEITFAQTDGGLRENLNSSHLLQSTLENSVMKEKTSGKSSPQTQPRSTSAISLSESPPFRGFKSVEESQVEKLWSSSSLTVEKMLDIITVEKTSPMAKMLISSVIGFPTVESVSVSEYPKICVENLESTALSVELTNPLQRLLSQGETVSHSSKNEKRPLSMKTRSCVRLRKLKTVKPHEEKEASPNVSKQNSKIISKTVSSLDSVGDACGFKSTNTLNKLNSRQPGQLRILGNSKQQNIIEMVYDKKEQDVSQKSVDTKSNSTRSLRSSHKVDSNCTTKVQNADDTTAENVSDSVHDFGTKMREIGDKKNKNLLVIKQYTNNKRPDNAAKTLVNSDVMRYNSKAESHKKDNKNHIPSKVCNNSECDRSENRKPVDTIDCASEPVIEKTKESKDNDKRQEINSCQVNRVKRRRSSTSETSKMTFAKDLSETLVTNSDTGPILQKDLTHVSATVMQFQSTKELQKSNNNVIAKVITNDNIDTRKYLEITPRFSESEDIHTDSQNPNFSANTSSNSEPNRENLASNESESASKEKLAEQIRLVKRSRVRVKRKMEIANLVIDMNMSPRSQKVKSRRSLRGRNYLRRRICPVILDRSRKRADEDPVKHPTSPMKSLKKNVQSSAVKNLNSTNPKKGLTLRRKSTNCVLLSNNNNIDDNKRNSSVKRIGRTKQMAAKKMSDKEKKNNVGNGRKIAEIPKIIHKRDSIVAATKQRDEAPPRHSRRETAVRSQSGRSPRGLTIGRLGLRRSLLPNTEPFVRKKKKEREKTNAAETLKRQDPITTKQSLSKRKLTNFGDLDYNIHKLSMNAKKPKMVSVMTQYSPPLDPLPHLISHVTPSCIRTNNVTNLSKKMSYFTSCSESECTCVSRKSSSEQIKPEVIDLIETKSEVIDDDVIYCEIENDKIQRSKGSAFKQNNQSSARSSFEWSDQSEKCTSLQVLSSYRNDRRSELTPKLTAHDRSDTDSVPKKGFIRYVANRRQSAFVPVRSVEEEFKITQLESIGFKPIKPGIFPLDEHEDSLKYERRSTGDSPRIIYSSAVVKRGVNEEYEKYTSEENNVVQYMDSELCYEDIENEDKFDDAIDYEMDSNDDFVQKMEFIKLGTELEDESNDNLQIQEEEEEEEDDDEQEVEEDEERDEEGEEEEDFNIVERNLEWKSHLEVDSSSSENTEQAMVDSDGDVPWHGWKKIISNKKTYFVGW